MSALAEHYLTYEEIIASGERLGGDFFIIDEDDFLMVSCWDESRDLWQIAVADGEGVKYIDAIAKKVKDTDTVMWYSKDTKRYYTTRFSRVRQYMSSLFKSPKAPPAPPPPIQQPTSADIAMEEEKKRKDRNRLGSTYEQSLSTPNTTGKTTLGDG